MSVDLTISVIIPNYNRSQQLLKAIISVLNQTLPVLEILVCDDGSTDDSKTLVSKLNNPLVRWIDCGRNGRPAIPRNKGIKESQGTWLAFLDNDDEWLPQKLEKQFAAVKQHGSEVVCCNAIKVSHQVELGAYHTLNSDRALDFSQLVSSNTVICSSILLKRSLFDKYGLFPEEPEVKALEDYALWLRICTGTDFSLLSEPLLYYNDESNTSIRQASLSTEEQRKILFFNFRTWYKKNKNKCTPAQFTLLEHTFYTQNMSRPRRILYKITGS